MTGARPAGRGELAVAVALLAVASALGCVLCSAWLMLRVGPVPLPLTVLAAAAWGWWLVRLARRWSTDPLVALVPSLVWIVTLVVLDLGPGGDTPVPISLRGLALLVAGGLLPLWWAVLQRVPAAHAPRG